MKIPYANRTIDIDLPQGKGSPKIAVKEVVDDFFAQLKDNFNSLFEAVVMMSPRTARVTCKTARATEEVMNLGLTFRNCPLNIRPCKSGKWVHITRLSYGVPSEAISEALQPYGKVIAVNMDTYRNVYLGVRNVLVDIHSPIPSRLRISDHFCHIFYQGQPKTCFACNKVGHDLRNCPQTAPRDAPVPHIEAPTGTSSAPVPLEPQPQHAPSDSVAQNAAANTADAPAPMEQQPERLPQDAVALTTDVHTPEQGTVAVLLCEPSSNPPNSAVSPQDSVALSADVSTNEPGTVNALPCEPSSNPPNIEVSTTVGGDDLAVPQPSPLAPPETATAALSSLDSMDVGLPSLDSSSLSAKLAPVSDGEDEFHDAQGIPSHKRDRSEDELSDSAKVPLEKKEKTEDPMDSIGFESPNMFSSLEDEAVNIPLPPEESSSEVSDRPLTTLQSKRRHRSRRSTKRETVAAGTSSSLEAPVQAPPDQGVPPVVGPLPVPRSTSLEPRTHLKSSSNVPDLLTLALTSKKTSPAPVFGTKKKGIPAGAAGTTN